ncbi:MAG: recombinase family protein [Cellulomonas sp.]|uniref:recombinase family protein n=1 Tax=Cellulomonas sp. TaxID=40001 RepID=UPI00258575F6|nr:recombinase family protein [Cellulomonas sp.]MCR6706494.1 recombinase family protein [Cellulomonas sp.]
MDTTTAQGTFIFHLFAALAELERGMVRERTLAGLAAARERGRVGGRPSVWTPRASRGRGRGGDGARRS